MTSPTWTQRLARGLALGILAATASTGLSLATAPANAGPVECNNATPGSPDPGDLPWVQDRLDFARVAPLADGQGIVVAVLDSGLNQDNPQTKAIKVVNPLNVLPRPYRPTDIRDCVDVGHGTGVSAIIAAPALPGVGFRGLAPGATIMPIKFSDPDTEDLSTADVVAAGIEAAVAAQVDVINVSLTTLAETPRLRAAVQAAGAADIVIVAASGNEGEEGNRAGYPSEYAADPEQYPHLIAVGATDTEDKIASFSTSGAFVGVAAPGAQIRVPTPVSGYAALDGTSFATPFVSATAALIRQRFPRLTAPEVVQRIEATADRPGVAVPDPGYGYGILNPYVALTDARDDNAKAPRPEKLKSIAGPDIPPPPDRTLQEIAYAVTAGLVGVAAIVLVGSMAWRRSMANRRAMEQQAANSY